jgi:CRP/FNR family transcriptional regulator, cyclic AMP receptor protein
MNGDIFRTLAPLERAELERLIAANVYSPGQIFHSPNEFGEQLFVLRSGRVRLYKLSPEGRALTLAVLDPIAIFGEMALVEPHLHDSFAEAMTESVVGVIGRDTLRSVLERHPLVAIAFMEVMGSRLRSMESRLADIAFKSVPQRLASILLGLAGVERGTPPVVPPVLRYTHQQLAEMIGSYRETVTKALGDLREADLVRVSDDGITLVDIEKLRRLANR